MSNYKNPKLDYLSTKYNPALFNTMIVQGAKSILERETEIREQHENSIVSADYIIWMVHDIIKNLEEK